MKRNWFFLAMLALGILMGGLVQAAEEDATAILRRVEEKQATETSVSRMKMFIYQDAGADIGASRWWVTPKAMKTNI